MKSLFILSITAVIAFHTQLEQRTGWRGIIPLRSTRTQVERELGTLDLKCQCYKTEKEIVHVKYARDRCTGDLPGWNVLADTVLSVEVSPKSEHVFSELEPRKEDFVETRDHSFTTYYGNGNRGIRYSVSSTGLVVSISYVPSVKDNHLRCPGFPPTDGGITAYSPNSEFPFDTLDDITARLGEFIIRLQESPKYKGYIIVYARHDKVMPGVGEFASAARNYLIKEFETDPKTIEAITGGYREQATVELFLIPSAWPPPVATPTFGALVK